MINSADGKWNLTQSAREQLARSNRAHAERVREARALEHRNLVRIENERILYEQKKLWEQQQQVLREQQQQVLWQQQQEERRRIEEEERRRIEEEKNWRKEVILPNLQRGGGVMYASLGRPDPDHVFAAKSTYEIERNGSFIWIVSDLKWKLRTSIPEGIPLNWWDKGKGPYGWQIKEVLIAHGYSSRLKSIANIKPDKRYGHLGLIDHGPLLHVFKTKLTRLLLNVVKEHFWATHPTPYKSRLLGFWNWLWIW